MKPLRLEDSVGVFPKDREFFRSDLSHVICLLDANLSKAQSARAFAALTAWLLLERPSVYDVAR